MTTNKYSRATLKAAACALLLAAGIGLTGLTAQARGTHPPPCQRGEAHNRKLNLCIPVPQPCPIGGRSSTC